jgi:hypothetical protein
LQQVFGARNTIYGLRQISERSPGAFLREYYGKGARARQFDAVTLARKARKIFGQMVPKARCFVGDAMQLSFWLIGNFPFDNDQRQKLLELPDGES